MAEEMSALLNSSSSESLQFKAAGTCYSTEGSRIKSELNRDWENHYVKLLSSTYKKVLRLSSTKGHGLSEETWRDAVYSDAEEVVYLSEGLAVEM